MAWLDLRNREIKWFRVAERGKCVCYIELETSIHGVASGDIGDIC